jgi:hypothetical protein
MVISTNRNAPVGMVLPSRAGAFFAPASRLATIPDPITVASRKVVPRNSVELQPTLAAVLHQISQKPAHALDIDGVAHVAAVTRGVQ